MRTRLLILQPTPFCNIDCDYCDLTGRASTARMSIATVKRAAERLRDDGLAGPELTVVWHAGEPLAMPLAFYDEAVVMLREVFGAACAVSHLIQTNATLIDDAWCALFERHAMRIGVSVDGPADLHTAHRRTRTGRGTHERVLGWHGAAARAWHCVPRHRGGHAGHLRTGRCVLRLLRRARRDRSRLQLRPRPKASTRTPAWSATSAPTRPS